MSLRTHRKRTLPVSSMNALARRKSVRSNTLDTFPNNPWRYFTKCWFTCTNKRPVFVMLELFLASRAWPPIRRLAMSNCQLEFLQTPHNHLPLSAIFALVCELLPTERICTPCKRHCKHGPTDKRRMQQCNRSALQPVLTARQRAPQWMSSAIVRHCTRDAKTPTSSHSNTTVSASDATIPKMCIALTCSASIAKGVMPSTPAHLQLAIAVRVACTVSRVRTQTKPQQLQCTQTETQQVPCTHTQIMHCN